MSTPTPGPWELNTQDTGLNDSGTILGAGVVIVPDIYGRSKVECDANARLIAAAPDMLEALNELIAEWTHAELGGIAIEETGGMLLARQALAKAEGRA